MAAKLMARARIHNGVDLTALSDLIAEVKANPELGKLQVQAHAQWQGGGRCVIRLSPPGENGGTESPPFSIAADSLSSLVADQGAANAGQLLLAALASDLVAGFVRNASQRGIRIESLDIETDGVLELDHQLGLRESADEGLGGISVNLRVDADNNVEQLEDLWSEAQQTSPIISLLRTSGRISFSCAVVRSKQRADE